VRHPSPVREVPVPSATAPDGVPLEGSRCTWSDSQEGAGRTSRRHTTQRAFPHVRGSLGHPRVSGMGGALAGVYHPAHSIHNACTRRTSTYLESRAFPLFSERNVCRTTAAASRRSSVSSGWRFLTSTDLPNICSKSWSNIFLCVSVILNRLNRSWALSGMCTRACAAAGMVTATNNSHALSTSN
jgi:hypothetical protein